MSSLRNQIAEKLKRVCAHFQDDPDCADLTADAVRADIVQPELDRLRGDVELLRAKANAWRESAEQAEAKRDRLRGQRDEARAAVRAAAQLAEDAYHAGEPTQVDPQQLAEAVGEVDQYCPACWRLHGTWCAPYGGQAAPDQPANPRR